MTNSLLQRLWVYQSERFPLAKTVPLLAIFSAASISISAQLSDRPLPHWSAFLVGFVLAMVLFFQMRVCDEYKDLEDDRNFRPDRPIPRGLVSLGTIINLGLLTLPVAAAVAWLWYPPLLWLLVLVWLWLGAMTAEFGVPHWLKSRPILYLVSHMAIMPLINLLLTGVEWMPNGNPPPQLWLFLALSFVNGCVVEIGRKLWAPENEINGVETYSGLWGPRVAAWAWLGCVGLSYGLLVTVGFAAGVGWASIAIGAVGVGFCLQAAMIYLRSLSGASQQRLDRLAGIWVFLCYAVAGFLPFVPGAF
ncbi:MAG: UbiA family prenyltransferase [Rhodobacteraceae bacterium]|nr:UbiA family prenyltransferase [Paracoccaceae bacterium]